MICMTTNNGIAPQQRVAAASFGVGFAVQADGQGRVQVATQSIRTTPFHGVVVETATLNQQVGVQINGLLDPRIKNLGSGPACMVGVDVNGNPVRATDVNCVSAPNWLGSCDAQGNIVIAPVIRAHFDVRDFGAIPDYVEGGSGPFTPNLAAFTAALVAAGQVVGLNNGLELKIMGRYYLEGTLNIGRTTTISGSGDGADDLVPPSMLAFPTNTDGIVFQSIFQTGGSNSSSDSSLRDIAISTVLRGTSGNGITVLSPVRIERVSITNFGGHGVLLNSGRGVGAVDGAMFLKVDVGQNGQQGFHIEGGDSNVCSFISCESGANGGWGFYDASAGGGTFIACHAEGNQGFVPGVIGSTTTGSAVMVVNDATFLQVGMKIQVVGLSGTQIITTVSGTNVTLATPATVTVSNATITMGESVDGRNHDYKTLNLGTTTSMFLGCYSEASLNDITYPASVLGGLLASSPNYVPTAFVLNVNTATEAAFTYDNPRGNVRILAALGEPSTNQRILSMQDNPTGAGEPWSLDYHDTAKVWVWRPAQAGDWNFGFPQKMSGLRAQAPIGRPGFFIQSPFTSSGYILMTSSNAPPSGPAPSGGDWQQGDVVWNSAPNSNSDPGYWQCVVSGTPGTWIARYPAARNPVPIIYATNHTLMTDERYVTMIDGYTIATLPLVPTPGELHDIKSLPSLNAPVYIDANNSNLDENVVINIQPGTNLGMIYSDILSSWEVLYGSYNVEFDPSNLALSGWWRDYAGTAPWSGRASAGPSSSSILNSFGSDPGLGTAVNGYIPALFNGTNFLISNVSATSLFNTTTGANAGTIVALINIASAAAPNSTPYDDAGICCTYGSAYLTFGCNSSGIRSAIIDTAVEDLGTVAAPLSTWILAQMRWGGGQLQVRINDGAWTSISIGDMGSLGTPVVIGGNYIHNADLNGEMLELMTAASDLSDSELDQIRLYCNRRYQVGV